MNTKEMNNLKVGDYVRTKNGIIGEYISDDNEYNDCIVIDDSKSIKTLFNDLQSQLDIANKKLDKIKELVNKYGYYTLSEIPELLSIIDGKKE